MAGADAVPPHSARLEFAPGMPPPSTPTSGSDLAGIGLYLAGAVLVPLIGGVLLDSALHTAPVFVLIGLFVGLVAGGVVIWLKVRELSK